MIFVQGAITTGHAQEYQDLGVGFCRDNNGMYPNAYYRNDGYSKATCQAECSSESACVAFQVGVDADTGCVIYGAAISQDTAPRDWQFGYGNGGTDNITQTVSSGKHCFKKATCGSTRDCDVLLGAGYYCQDGFCRKMATTTSITSSTRTSTMSTSTASTVSTSASTARLASPNPVLVVVTLLSYCRLIFTTRTECSPQ